MVPVVGGHSRGLLTPPASRTPGAVRLYGGLDIVCADDVHDALVGCPGRDVVADLANLELIDSTGLSALLLARHALESSGRRLELRGATGATRRAIEAIGLEDVLDDRPAPTRGEGRRL